LRDSNYVYRGADFGKLWVCSRFPECDSYVGCHNGTTTAKGTLADRQIREARKRAHTAFDTGWMTGVLWENRKQAYNWIRQIMNLDDGHAHIAMMDAEQCETLISKIRERAEKVARRKVTA